MDKQKLKSAMKRHEVGLDAVITLQNAMHKEAWNQLELLTTQLTEALGMEVEYNIAGYEHGGFPIVDVTIDGNDPTLVEGITEEIYDDIMGAYVNLAAFLQEEF